MKGQIRQGDVCLQPVEGMTPSAQAKVVTDQGRTILAYGEVTGHVHEIVSETTSNDHDPVPAQQLFEEPDGSRLLVVKGPATFLRHDTHSKLHVPAGSYKVIGQMEYTPAALRPVTD